MTQVIYPNGISQTQTWNADNTLAQISHQNGATIIAQDAFGYDGLGRRQTNTETLSGQTTLSYTYGYDALDRLISVGNGTAAQTETYGYDRIGNRVQKQIGNPVTSTYAYLYDAANQLSETHQTSTTGTLLEAYLYDKSGNETQKCSGGTVTHTSTTACTGSTVQGYVYNSFNKMAQYNGAITGNYLYDHQGRRIQKIEGVNALNYLYDGKNVYEEYLTSSWSTPNALYVQAGIDHPLARLIGTVGAPTATAAYYHQDGIGSVLATTSASKSVSATQRFNAFGATLTRSGTIVEYGYTGREPDASGLIYYRARYYDPNQIRFTQRDPLGIKAGINQYAYVNANPVNFNDPDGLIANSISNAYTQTASYFSNNSYAAFGSGLAVGGAAGYGLGYGLAALSSACLPCGAVASVGLAGYGAYQLGSNNFAGAQNIYNSFQAVGNGTATPGQAFTAGSTLGGVIGGGVYGYTSSNATSGTTTLYRAVMPSELADIQTTNAFNNLGSAEGKYFTTSAEAASSYAKQAVNGFGDPPYTLVQTQVPNSIFNGLSSASVDRGIPAWVIPNDRLSGLIPEVLNSMPIP